MRGLWALMLGAIVGTGLVAGCAPSAVVDSLPGEVGLPSNAPARPTEAYRLLYELRSQGLEGDELYWEFQRKYRSVDIIEDALFELIQQIERAQLIMLTSPRLKEQAFMA